MRQLLGPALLFPLMMAATDSAALDSIAAACELEHNLDEVVVTGTLTPKALKDTPVATRLITAKELKRADATDLQGLLQSELPGVEFSYAMNQQVNMNLAGFAGQGVLILVDGERLAGETMDNVDYSRLTLSNASRIEIVRGSASAIYGSSAAGGVINIISKETTDRWRADLRGRAGAHGYWRAEGHAGMSLGHVTNDLDVAFNRTGGYNVCLDAEDECDFRRVPGSSVWNLSDRLTYRVLDNLRLTARASYYFKERLYNPDIPDRYRDYSAGLRGKWTISGNNQLELSYAFDRYDKSDFIKAFNRDVRDYSNVQHSAKALYNHTLRRADVLTAGADLIHDWLDTYQFAAGETHSQLSADIFAQYDWCISRHWEVVGALRCDYINDGSTLRLTPKLNARYRVNHLTLRGGYAAGFRAPTLKEKYMRFNMADIFEIYGNRDLRPESSNNFNLSAEYSWCNLYFSAGVNFNLVNDRITTSSVKYTETKQPYIEYVNLERQKVVSVDATVRGSWVCGLSASLAYNFTHENAGASGLNQYCPARPHAINARVNWHHDWRKGMDFDVSLSGRFLSQVSYETLHVSEPFDAYTVTNPAYTLWKLQASQRLWDCVDVTLAVDNILNYIPAVYSFNAPVTTGTTLEVGVNIQIDKIIRK